MFLIVGLGNPGREYEATRHNVGFLVVDALAAQSRINLSANKFEGEYGQGSLEGQKVALLKPQTFMNLSGASVAPAAKFYKVEPEQLVVIHDELDLGFGRIQVKVGGGTGGHNGLKSIVDRLGVQDFVRIRIGIDKPVAQGQGQKDVAGWVLSPFPKDQRSLLDEVVKKAADAARGVVGMGAAKAMNEFNRK